MSEAASPEQQQTIFNIEKLYVKDLSLEVPHAPNIFLEREAPQIDLQLNTNHAEIDQGIFEVTITITLTAKLEKQDKVIFLIEATQGGIFRLQNIPEGELGAVLAIVCPNILYPYIREVVTDVSVRAGFAPVLLNPVNFEVLYQQSKNQATATETKH